MSSETRTDTQVNAQRRDFRSYCIGALSALLLTAIAFGLVAYNVLPAFELRVAVSLLAVIQIAVHFRYFMHISWRSHRDDLQLILFTCLILFLMVGGSIWIMANLHERMM
jgi:cytochrome o ubiquinol oxidase subunit IV